MRVAAALLATWLAFAANATSVPVEEDYLLQCQACHGGDGAGSAPRG